MVSLSLTKHVEAPPEKVFHVFTDVDRAAERISGIEKVEKLTDGPVGKGTRFRETRIMFKRECTEELEYTAFEPNRACTLSCDSCGAEYHSTYRFVPNGSGTRVEFEMVSRPKTFMAKLMSPLSRLMMGSMRKALEKDMDELKAAAENGVG